MLSPFSSAQKPVATRERASVVTPRTERSSSKHPSKKNRKKEKQRRTQDHYRESRALRLSTVGGKTVIKPEHDINLINVI